MWKDVLTKFLTQYSEVVKITLDISTFKGKKKIMKNLESDGGEARLHITFEWLPLSRLV